MTDTQYNMEQDMRHVFDNALQSISTLRDKTISALISHSRQASELEELKQKFADMSQRMDTVVQEAQRIRQDLHLTITERDKFKKEAEENLHLAQGYEKERDEAREELRTVHASRAQAESDLQTSKRELEHANNLVTRLRGDVEWVQQRNTTLLEERNESRKQVSQLETALKEANDKLGTLQNTFKTLFPDAPRAMVEEAKPVEVPGIAPSFHSEGAETGRLPDFQPHPVQSVGESEVQPASEGSSVSEQTEETPWWKKDQPKAS